MRKALVLVKLEIPGDGMIVSDVVRIPRFPIGREKPSPINLKEHSYHTDSDGRRAYLLDALASKASADSLLKIVIVLATPDGNEVPGGEIASFQYSLKEMRQVGAQNRQQSSLLFVA